MHAETCMSRNTHTSPIQLLDYNRANSQQPDVVGESRGGWRAPNCICMCVSKRACVREMLPLGSQNPCRAFAVLLRQPQPSREHHRQRREGREGAWIADEGEECWGSHLLRREGRMKDANNWNMLHAVVSPGLWETQSAGQYGKSVSGGRGALCRCNRCSVSVFLVKVTLSGVAEVHSHPFIFQLVRERQLKTESLMISYIRSYLSVM